MVLNVAPLLCLFIIVLDIFTVKDTTKTHYNNARLNILDNAPLAIYKATLAKHWLVMGFKTDNSLVDAQLSKMEAAIENIASLATVGNLAVNQLMEHEATIIVTAKVASTEEPKWTTVITKNVHQVVETLADTLKHEEHKFNLCFMGFKAKEGEIEKKLVQQLNT
jgi:hypothetical protein